MDNSPTKLFENDKIGKMLYVHNGANLGIASAQNKGVAACLDKHSDITHFVFLDQDTRVDIDYPEHIALEMDKAQEQIGNVGIIGPSVINSTTEKPYESHIHKDKSLTKTFYEKLFVISSGCCITHHVWNRVGSFEDNMFIDFVDSEWCWRAKREGFHCISSNNVTISHKVGQHLFKIGPYQDIISKSFRYFYQYRNYIWLCKRDYVPLKWKVTTGIKYLLRFMYVPFTSDNGNLAIRNMVKGIIEGLRQ